VQYVEERCRGLAQHHVSKEAGAHPVTPRQGAVALNGVGASRASSSHTFLMARLRLRPKLMTPLLRLRTANRSGRGRATALSNRQRPAAPSRPASQAGCRPQGAGAQAAPSHFIPPRTWNPQVLEVCDGVHVSRREPRHLLPLLLPGRVQLLNMSGAVAHQQPHLRQ
jgi:hypothetical protein